MQIQHHKKSQNTSNHAPEFDLIIRRHPIHKVIPNPPMPQNQRTSSNKYQKPHKECRQAKTIHIHIIS